MKVFIISAAAIILGISMYGTFSLEVGFDPTFYLAEGSATLKMMDYGDKYFPKYNETPGLFIFLKLKFINYDQYIVLKLNLN